MQQTFADVYCATCTNKTCAYVPTTKSRVSLTVKNAKPSAQFFIQGTEANTGLT